MKRLLILGLFLTLILVGRPTQAQSGDPVPTVSVSWDKSSYPVGDQARLTAIVRGQSGGLSGICVTYNVTISGTNFQNNSGACGTADLTDASGSVSWLLQDFLSTGSYNAAVTSAPSPGFAAAGSGSGSTQVVPAFGPQPNPGTSTPPAATPSSTTVELPNPIACNDATCLIGQVVRYILGTIAVIATLMFVWGGVMMLTSGGNADQVKRAKETLVWATIGVIVILLSWVIIKAVLQALTNTSS